MGTPLEHLPSSIGQHKIENLFVNLQLPQPTSVNLLEGNPGQFHIIYLLQFDIGVLEPHFIKANINQDDCHQKDLILRISGNHISQIKTDNEVAILSWLKTSTKIPTPYVVAHDSSTHNALGHEFILMTRAKGVSMTGSCPQSGSEQMDSFLDQILDIQAQLHAHEWSHIGGLRLVDGKIIPGPHVAEDQWFLPEILEYFPGETFETVNALGPFATYVDSVVADISRYMHIITIHESLAWMRPTIPMLKSFIDVIQANADSLNRTKICLAHKDLHFGNIMVDSDTTQITAILDWEFSGPTPLQRWNPHNSFLWNATADVNSKAVQSRLVERYTSRAEERGYGYLLEDSKYSSPLQEHMQTVRDYCRAIVEVCPRGQRQDLVHRWREIMLTALKEFGVE